MQQGFVLIDLHLVLCMKKIIALRLACGIPKHTEVLEVTFITGLCPRSLP